MRFADFTAFDLVLLAQGLGVNIALFLATSLIGMVIGIAWAIVRYYRVPVLSEVITFVSELLKNSPVLVQLFLVFFGLPGLFHIRVTPVTAATITLSANTAAFVYVIAVSAIESIGRDQIEAARVFGLTRWQVLRHVVAPQAMAFAIGPLIALLVNQLQVTSLISVIGVVDMVFVAQQINLDYFTPFEPFTAIAVILIVLVALFSIVLTLVERALRLP